MTTTSASSGPGPNLGRLPYSETVHGPTPNGGVRAVAYFRDSTGTPTTKALATSMEIIEYDRAGKEICRTYGGVGHDSPQVADVVNSTQPLSVRDYRQQSDYDCAAACVAAVANYFGLPDRPLLDYVRELGTTKSAGTPPASIATWFTQQGLIVTSGPGMTIANLELLTGAGVPVIIPIQLPSTSSEGAAVWSNRNGHYVVVKGVKEGLVYYQDPVSGPSSLDVSVLDSIWHDVEGDERRSVSDHYGIAVYKTLLTWVLPS